MLIPDSAHGTNPASAHLSGFTVKTIRSTAEGLTDLDHLRELCAHGVDFSFAPVVDLDYGRSSVIGDRAFGTTPEVVARQRAIALQVGQQLLHAVGQRLVGAAAVGGLTWLAEWSHGRNEQRNRLRHLVLDAGSVPLGELHHQVLTGGTPWPT